MKTASDFSAERSLPTANQIRQARAALRLSQRELASLAQIGLNTLVAFERETRPPFASTAQKLRAALEAKGIRFVDGGVVLEHEAAAEH